VFTFSIYEIYEYLPDIGAMNFLSVEQPPTSQTIQIGPEQGFRLTNVLNSKENEIPVIKGKKFIDKVKPILGTLGEHIMPLLKAAGH